MNCPLCLQQVSGGEAFCPHCGARLAEPGTQTALEAAQDPTYGALAFANLMRLRGDWEGAREKTVAVMREFPNNGTAHSLLGDIFSDQQLYAEAAQWYRMALDLEPNNAADARKLVAAEAHLRPPEESAAAVPEGPTQFSVFRVAAVASLAFLVFAISLGFYVKTQTVPLSDLGPAWKAHPKPSRTTPQPKEMGQGNSATTPPVNIPGILPTTGPALHSAREAALASALNDVTAAPVDGTGFVDVVIDPSTETAVITLSGDGIDSSSKTWMQALYSSALNAARRALNSDVALRTAKVRVVMRIEDEHGTAEDVAFVGGMDRPAPGGFSGVGTSAVFSRRWWRPGLTPPAAIGTAAHESVRVP